MSEAGEGEGGEKRGGLLRAFFDVHREERLLAGLMFGYFFLVITSFWVLKPLKKALFFTTYDAGGVDLFGLHWSAAQAELFAKVGNMFVAYGAVVLFSALATRLRREQLSYAFSVLFLAGFAAFAWLLGTQPSDASVWSFYFFGDLYSTLMVATFFSFLNDSVDPGAAKRLYGVVGLGGVLGGSFGSTTVAAGIDTLSLQAWLAVTAGLGVTIVGLAALAGREAARLELASRPEAGGPSEVVPQPAGNPALAGARLALRSRYLLSVVAIVGIYEVVSTILDFQFSATIAHYLDGPAVGAHFSRVFALTNNVSLLVQLFATSLVLRRFGVGTALLVLPVAILAGSGAFAVLPVLWVGSLLNTADNGFSYSINQSAKEALYVPTTREEKYKAKAFIDMFVQRFAKALAVGVSLAISAAFGSFESIRWLSLLTLPLGIAWLLAARAAGRRFAELEQARG